MRFFKVYDYCITTVALVFCIGTTATAVVIVLHDVSVAVGHWLQS